MAKFPFLGYDTRLYTQYIDNEADSTLIALPGESYDMRPAGSRDLPVPPADGLWGDVPDIPVAVLTAQPVPAALPAPPPVVTAPPVPAPRTRGSKTMATYASAVYPVPNRFVNVGKEAQPGSIAAGTYTFPLTTFKPVDKYTRLEDNAWRNAMAQLYNLIDGVRISDVSLGGPFFADGIGYPLMDILGDYWQGVVGGVVGHVLVAAVNSAVGAGTIVVASATGMTWGHIISIGGTATTGEEVRSVTNVSGRHADPQRAALSEPWVAVSSRYSVLVHVLYGDSAQFFAFERWPWRRRVDREPAAHLHVRGLHGRPGHLRG